MIPVLIIIVILIINMASYSESCSFTTSIFYMAAQVFCGGKKGGVDKKGKEEVEEGGEKGQAEGKKGRRRIKGRIVCS